MHQHKIHAVERYFIEKFSARSVILRPHIHQAPDRYLGKDEVLLLHREPHQVVQSCLGFGHERPATNRDSRGNTGLVVLPLTGPFRFPEPPDQHHENQQSQ